MFSYNSRYKARANNLGLAARLLPYTQNENLATNYIMNSMH